MPARRCLLCHRENAADAWQCACDRERGQSAEAVRALLRIRQTNAWIALALLVVIDVAAIGGLVHAASHGFIVMSSVAFTVLLLTTARRVRTIQLVRASLRALDRRTAMPRAVVYRR